MSEPSTDAAWARPRGLRTQALIGALLAFGLFVVGARLVERHLRAVADLSEDGLLSFSPAADVILDRLEDVAQLELFVTGEIENGSWQLAKNRLLEQLAELSDRSGGRLQVVRRDPSRSSQARLEAVDYGIPSQSIGRSGGGVLVAQEVFMGGVLRYRGAERVLPRLRPAGLEFVLLSSLHALMQPRPLRVGWLAGGDDPKRFDTARDLLARRVEIVSLGGLSEGRPVGDVDVLVVAGPVDLHPRAAFEIERWTRAGGALLAVIDRSDADPQARRFEVVDTGLEPVLDAWGVHVSRAHLWDQGSHRAVPMVQVAERDGQAVPIGRMEVPYPLWVDVGPDGLDPAHPTTARLPRLPLSWAHPIEAEGAPPGVERTELARTSERTYIQPFAPEMVLDVEGIRLVDTEFLMSGDGRRYTVAAALVGVLPSAFAADGPPPARDAFGGPERALAGDDELAQDVRPARVVIVGDADWLATSPGAGARIDPAAQLFLENAIDWLGAAPELLALRSKLPRDRSIVDLVEEEFTAAGLSRVRGRAGATESAERSAAETAAIARADARRRRLGGTALAGSLLAAGALALGAGLRRRARLGALESAVGGGTPC